MLDRREYGADIPNHDEPSTEKIPHAMAEKCSAVIALTDAFCERHLDDEYRALIHRVIGALARKRPSPLLKGKESVWAAAAVHAAGRVNFLDDLSPAHRRRLPDLSRLPQALQKKSYAPLTSGIAWRGRRGMAEDRGRGTRKGQGDYRV